MKKLIIPFLAALLFATSCKDDFEIAAPYKQITLAYGLINRDDTAHYIRIEKAFLDDSKSAIEMSKVPDSSYYDTTAISVVIKEMHENGTLLRVLPMYRVDMAAEGYPKNSPGKDGFFTAPHYAYKLSRKTLGNVQGSDSLDPYKRYRLVITHKNTGIVDSSDILYVVNSRRVKENANDFYISSFVNAGYILSFAKTSLKESYQLTGRTPKNAKSIEGMVRFHFVEKDAVTNTKKRIDADYFFDTETKNSSESFTLETTNISFYGFIRDALGTPDANKIRYIDSCDIYVYAGSNELYNYYTIANVQNSSLLGDQIKPIYTNMRGANAYGLIASRAFRSYLNVPISKETIDSIKANTLTRDLQIVGVSED